MNKKTLLAGLITGTAIGAAAALLNAPMSGRETREKLHAAGAFAKSSGEEIKNDVTQIKTAVKNLTAVSKEQLGDIPAGLKVSAALWRESAEPHLHNLQKEMTELQSTVKELQTALPAPGKKSEPK
ncbi:YtxH domain-containing protein [Bacillus xiapuensis]|uniref:YtxH domain-containing protein n=1 Tax=Bacillus xiapuensis TaxID=2014075 RepID=UPI000C23EA00|nr:YtxH domain-containing protein [Bacillus xiapuensis]